MRIVVFFVFIFAINPFVIADNFSLSSETISNGSLLINRHVGNKFGCAGDDISPQLSWNNPPQGTKGFAITILDPDAMGGVGVWHWVAFNIPLIIKRIPESVDFNEHAPQTIVGMNDLGITGFSGACPPVGEKAHRYILTIHALSSTLPTDLALSPKIIIPEIEKRTIESASIEALYGR